MTRIPRTTPPEPDNSRPAHHPPVLASHQLSDADLCQFLTWLIQRLEKEIEKLRVLERGDRP